MAWDLEADRPIYAQLVERIQMQIVSGHYQPGGRLPSVRELAAVAAVNPNTMQKAFAELERSGLIITQRTNGRTVTENEELIRSIKSNLAKEHVWDFFTKMKEIGYSESEAVELLKRQIGQETDGLSKGQIAQGAVELSKGQIGQEATGLPEKRIEEES